MKYVEAAGQFLVEAQARLFGRGEPVADDTEKCIQLNPADRISRRVSNLMQARVNVGEELFQTSPEIDDYEK